MSTKRDLIGLLAEAGRRGGIEQTPKIGGAFNAVGLAGVAVAAKGLR